MGLAEVGDDVVPACLHRRHGAATACGEDRHAADNVKTMALVEAGYRSIDKGRAVKLSEISIN
jgi:predicted dehydrogenase